MANIIINNYAPTDYNLLDYSSWIVGTTGHTSDLSYYSFYYPPDTGGNNSRVMDTNPYNQQDVVWQSDGQALYPTTTRGGYNSSSEPTGANKVPIDSSKTYRYSVWLKKVVAGYIIGNQGLIYGGSRSWVELDDTIATSLVRVYPAPSGATSSNTYWFYIGRGNANIHMPVGEWRLAVGYIYPYEWTGTTLDTRAGLYDMSGSLIFPSAEQWAYGADTNYTSLRLFAPYDELSGATWQNYAPRIDLVDGTEPSIQELINGSYLQASKIGLLENTDNNLYDVSDWGTLTTGDTSMFNAYNTEAENYRKLDTNPWGENDYVWANSGLTVGNVNYGGWNESATWDTIIVADHTKSYRCSMWHKRKVKSTAGLFYFGLRTFNAPSGFIISNIRVSDNHISNNHYFLSLTYTDALTYTPEDEWRLFVYYIRPSTWTGTTTTDDAGIYKPDGTKIFSGFEYKMSGTTAYICTRTLSYQLDINAVHYNYLPRIDLIDGTEPSIQQLLSGTPKTNLFVLCEEVFPLTVTLLIVGGGNGGTTATISTGYFYSYYGGNGGKGGDVIYTTGMTLSGNMAVVVGAGGSSHGGLATSSSFNSISAGVSAFANGNTAKYEVGTNSYTIGSGGAGAGGNGGSASTATKTSGSGGAAVVSTISGASVSYGAGGRGGKAQSANNSGSAPGSTYGKGGQGGDIDPAPGAGGAGQAGVVIIRYTSATQRATGGTITQSGGDWIHTFTSSGTFTLT